MCIVMYSWRQSLLLNCPPPTSTRTGHGSSPEQSISTPPLQDAWPPDPPFTHLTPCNTPQRPSLVRTVINQCCITHYIGSAIRRLGTPSRIRPPYSRNVKIVAAHPHFLRRRELRRAAHVVARLLRGGRARPDVYRERLGARQRVGTAALAPSVRYARPAVFGAQLPSRRGSAPRPVGAVGRVVVLQFAQVVPPAAAAAESSNWAGRFGVAVLRSEFARVVLRARVRTLRTVRRCHPLDDYDTEQYCYGTSQYAELRNTERQRLIEIQGHLLSLLQHIRHTHPGSPSRAIKTERLLHCAH